MHKLESIQHFSFDKDGVLIDVHHYWVSVISVRARAICHSLGITSIETEDFLISAMGVDRPHFRIKKGGPIGYSPRPVVAAAALNALKETGERTISIQDIEEIFLEVDGMTTQNLENWCVLIQSVDQGLTTLWENDRTLSVVTSDRTALATQTLILHNLRQMFSTVIGGDRVKAGKPNPEGILLACEEVGISTKNTAYVGDTLGDMEAAKAAGVCAIGITSGLADAEELELSADFVISELTELRIG